MQIGPVIRRTKRSNRYCGPAVISALTGLDTSDAAATIRAVTGLRLVMGVYEGHLIAALKKYGIEAREVSRYQGPARPTLAGWLRGPRKADAVYLIIARKHWQLIQGDRYVCGQSKEVVGFEHKACAMRARVAAVWELSRQEWSDHATKELPECLKRIRAVRRKVQELIDDIEDEYLNGGMTAADSLLHRAPRDHLIDAIRAIDRIDGDDLAEIFEQEAA